MVKILLVGNYLLDQQESMLRFAAVMEKEFVLAGHEVMVIRPAAILRKLRYPKKIQKWAGYVDKFLFFPLVLRRQAGWADVVHVCDHSNAMYLKNIGSRPHLITCHDLLGVRSAMGDFPENPVGFSGKLLQSLITRGLKSAHTIVCVSEATRSDCMRILNINPESLHVVYHGLNYPYRQMPHEEADARLGKLGISNNRRFMMHIGNNSWYKNRIGVLKIFSQLVNHYLRDIDLILAGESLTPDMTSLIAETGIGHRVREVLDIANEDLCALYSRAEGLIFPSFEEGFGWPVLEAQASGCPVFTSNRAPMTEVGGDAAIYIEPYAPELSAAVINQHLDALQGIRERGLVNAKMFSTARMRDAYLDIHAQIVQGCK